VEQLDFFYKHSKRALKINLAQNKTKQKSCCVGIATARTEAARREQGWRDKKEGATERGICILISHEVNRGMLGCKGKRKLFSRERECMTSEDESKMIALRAAAAAAAAEGPQGGEDHGEREREIYSSTARPDTVYLF
jgi:hypothetical protein